MLRRQRRGARLRRAPVFDEGRLFLAARPADRAAFMNRMQRVDDDDRADQRNAGGDETVAIARQHLGLRASGEAGLGDPGGKFGKR